MPTWIDSLLNVIAIALGGWIGTRIITPTDRQRAELLDAIAQGAASFIVSMFPDKPWSELLKMVVQRIAAAAGLPTRNAAAIENAAAAALAKLGKVPSASR